MHNESGYILILVLILVCIITTATVLLLGPTVAASFFAARRSATTSALAMAENAAHEGLWRLNNDPSFRGTGQRVWNNERYEYSIIDASPGTTNDLSLDILGRGYVGSVQRGIRLRITRVNTASPFTIVGWAEENP